MTQQRTTRQPPPEPDPHTWDSVDLPTEQTEDHTAPALLDRYEWVGHLGAGGMGEVLAVRDRVLQRVVALKRVRRSASAAQRSRFQQEAQATAQLEHPGIVPVYDHGMLPDGRLFYTMQVVQGRTLDEVIQELHCASTDGSWTPGPSGIGFRRLIACFLDVCEAVAYAHDRGVIHRDLKPANVMIGAYGQTLVVDWGLAKVVTEVEPAMPSSGVSTTRASESGTGTSLGTVTGTPHYMPPEQARGAGHRAGPPSDVWSLGAILFEILTGRPPFTGSTRLDVIAAVLATRPPRADAATELPLPVELVDLVAICLQPEPEQRPPNAAAVADEVRTWLDGQRRREQALALVDRATALEPTLAAARARADELEVEAAERLRGLETWRPVAEKLPGWRLQDEAAALRAQADAGDRERLDLLRQAHALVPELPETNARLAAIYRRRWDDATARGDAFGAAELEGLIRAHDTGAHTAWLSGRAGLSLDTAPTGARVVARPFLTEERRLVPGPAIELGYTPVEAALPVGSYLLELTHPDRAPVRYPIVLPRGGAWSTTPPGADRPRPVRLPRRADLPPGTVWVPEGWFTFGGDPLAHAAGPATLVWVEAFAIGRVPVTNEDYLAFVDDQEPELAAAMVPRTGGELAWALRDGRYELVDPQGDVWAPDQPVVCVSRAQIEVYLAWRSRRDGLPWRLPTEVEWEKAARGPDRRIYPWGDHHDPTWTCVRGSRASGFGPAAVGSFPVDESPYGARDLAGNVSEICADTTEEGRMQVMRGSNWNGAAVIARVCTRLRGSVDRQEATSGFRLALTVR